MTERRKPTHELDSIKRRFARVAGLTATGTALRDAAGLGFNRAGIVAVIKNIERKHFYKSMPTYADHRMWQDVYHVPSDAGLLYVKFAADIMTEFVLVSFKEK